MTKKKTPKTNAARMLDRLGIPYELLTYPVDERDLSAAHVAEVTGIPLERIYKTLVVRGDRTGVFMAVVPGAGELDLKAAAAASGNKRAEMVHLKEVFDLTGYVRGGCSPLGAKKPYPVYCDESILHHEHVCVSAGRRGEQLSLAPADLIRAAAATAVPLVR
ncbi:Cys-tRNA(Pro) deacylase [Selenomonas massiliensis]|uniref:Cys-tRNA(Pro) deacylase n=1 Tax=Selenomonas massiliensis TaxID=2058293 RepID=UPI000D0FE378|nr:Cys-tRNA(Pro) deacylase [Selenomonas massiliensis]